MYLQASNEVWYRGQHSFEVRIDEHERRWSFAVGFVHPRELWESKVRNYVLGNPDALHKAQTRLLTSHKRFLLTSQDCRGKIGWIRDDFAKFNFF